MKAIALRLGFASAVLTAMLGATPATADDYVVDNTHAAANFRVSHLGLSWTYGRFKDISGTFTVDPGQAKFELSAKADSLDTDNAKRDEHLKSPDFFNTKQFPLISFKSTSAKANDKGYEVTGNLTLHGVTKPVTINLIGGRKAEFPKGVNRTGYTGEVSIKRSEFGMNKFAEAVGDEVIVTFSFEGTKK
ncbi:MAG: YceI family protein [Gemmataceae bacterium]|nr:YceI family protein [Gemmataceae bacterium]